MHEVAEAERGPAQPPVVTAAPSRRTRNPRLQPDVQSSFQANGAFHATPTPPVAQRFGSVADWMPEKTMDGLPPQIPWKTHSTHSGWSTNGLRFPWNDSMTSLRARSSSSTGSAKCHWRRTVRRPM